jgi:hypothetical protein
MSRTSHFRVLLKIASHCWLLRAASVSLTAAHFKQVLIRTSNQAGEIERNSAALLAERISEPSGIPVSILDDPRSGASDGNTLVILFGIPTNHPELRSEFVANRIEPLSKLSPGPEHRCAPGGDAWDGNSLRRSWRGRLL